MLLSSRCMVAETQAAGKFSGREEEGGSPEIITFETLHMANLLPFRPRCNFITCICMHMYFDSVEDSSYNRAA